MLETERISDLL